QDVGQAVAFRRTAARTDRIEAKERTGLRRQELVAAPAAQRTGPVPDALGIPFQPGISLGEIPPCLAIEPVADALSLLRRALRSTVNSVGSAVHSVDSGDMRFTRRREWLRRRDREQRAPSAWDSNVGGRLRQAAPFYVPPPVPRRRPERRCPNFVTERDRRVRRSGARRCGPKLRGPRPDASDAGGARDGGMQALGHGGQ